jgi:hypothetical protein
MKNLYLAIVLFCFNAYSQTFQWLQTPNINLTMSSDLVGYCNTTDAVGNVYFAGFKDNGSPYNDIFGDAWFNKYDQSGTLLFSKTFTGKCNIFDISVDAAGHVAMAIGYLATVTIGDMTLTNGDGGVRPLVAVFDTDGSLLWHYEPQIGPLPASYFKAIASDADGNVYAGYDNYNISVIEKLSPQGTPLFSITQPNVKLLSSLAVDTQGNIYAAGSCAEPNATFNGIAVPTTFDYNCWVVKYNSSGQYQWVKYVNDITCSHPEVAVYAPDKVYFSSYLTGAYQFDGLTAAGPSSGAFNDFFLTQLNETGTFQWVREVPGAGVANTGKRNYLATDSSGNAYFSGAIRGTVDWGNGFVSISQGTGSEALVLKYNSDGVMQYAKTAGGASEDRFDGVSVNATGDIYLSGMSRGNTTFDAITHTSAGVVPYCTLTKLGAVLGTASFNENQVRLYPNPAIHSFSLTYTSAAKGTVYNLLGIAVLSFENNGQPIAVDCLASGIYVVQCGTFCGQLVKQ